MIGKFIRSAAKEVIMLPANIAYGVTDAIDDITSGEPKPRINGCGCNCPQDDNERLRIERTMVNDSGGP